MSQSNRPASGYGRPPAKHQFKPGESGNPRGRPKGRRNFTTIFADVLSSKITVRDKNGTRRISKLEAMIEIMTNKAVAGDPQAFARIVQIAENLKESTWQPPVNHSAVLDGTYEKLSRGIERILKANAREEERTRLENSAKPQNNASKK